MRTKATHNIVHPSIIRDSSANNRAAFPRYSQISAFLPPVHEQVTSKSLSRLGV